MSKWKTGAQVVGVHRQMIIQLSMGIYMQLKVKSFFGALQICSKQAFINEFIYFLAVQSFEQLIKFNSDNSIRSRRSSTFSTVNARIEWNAQIWLGETIENYLLEVFWWIHCEWFRLWIHWKIRLIFIMTFLDQTNAFERRFKNNKVRHSFWALIVRQLCAPISFLFYAIINILRALIWAMFTYKRHEVL